MLRRLQDQTDDSGASMEDLAAVRPAHAARYERYAEGKKWERQHFGSFSAENDRYFSDQIDGFGIAIAGRRVLDIGFGNGAFLGWLRSRAAIPAGVEIQPGLVERARLFGVPAMAEIGPGLSDRLGGPLEACFAFDVLEHMDPDDIVAMLKCLAGEMAPGGLMLARFPNGDSPFGLIHTNGDWTHRCIIGRGMLLQILDAAGWDLLYLGDKLRSVRGWRERFDSLTLKASRWFVERVLFRSYLGTEPPPTLAMNYHVLIRPRGPEPGPRLAGDPDPRAPGDTQSTN
jgi:SAM-dependent methyltransferase